MSRCRCQQVIQLLPTRPIASASCARCYHDNMSTWRQSDAGTARCCSRVLQSSKQMIRTVATQSVVCLMTFTARDRSCRNVVEATASDHNEQSVNLIIHRRRTDTSVRTVSLAATDQSTLHTALTRHGQLCRQGSASQYTIPNILVH